MANEVTSAGSSSPSDSPEGSTGEPYKKRARFADDNGDVATEFADIEEERDEEDYDEYPDEDAGRDDDDVMEEGDVDPTGGELTFAEQVR